MREIDLTKEGPFHVCGRGVVKQTIFHDHRDYIRFLYIILFGTLETPFQNLGRQVSYYLKRGTFINSFTSKEVSSRKIKLAAFTIMPNHFHLLVEQIEEGSLSKYMHKTLTAYARYYSERYKHPGHVFQGPYKAIPVDTNDQLLYTSAYIHKNQMEIRDWKKAPESYPWSSMQDFVMENRWPQLLETKLITEQFGNKKEYSDFVSSSVAKEKDWVDI